MVDALASLDLPPTLQTLLDGLQLETCGVQASLRRHLQQMQSPLSLVRQDAYSGLAASLDAALADPARAPAVLPALGRVWPQLLAGIAMGLRQAPAARSGAPAGTPGRGGFGGGGDAAGAAAAAVSYRGITPGELTSMVRVLELACLLAPQARQTALAAGLLPLLLAQLPGAPPALATACLDALLALQLRSPTAFVAFAEHQGVQQVCQLLKDKDASEPVRGHAVQFLNLLLTQLAPELLPPEALPPTPSPAPSAARSLPSPGPGGAPAPLHRSGPSPTEGRPELQAAVAAGLEGAKGAVSEALGREARAMLLRRVSLSDATAEAKLGQLASALTLFVESDT